MNVKVLSISHSNKSHVLASVKFELSDDDGDSLIVDDARVLRNRHGQVWLAMPTRSVQHEKTYEYLPQVVLSTKLRRGVEDSVLPEYEHWAATQSPNGGAAR